MASRAMRGDAGGSAALLLALLLQACAGTKPVPTGDATPFDDLLAFCPNATEVVFCADLTRPDCPRALVEAMSPSDLPRVRREVLCASRFSFAGARPFEGVWLIEYEADLDALAWWPRHGAHAEFETVTLGGRSMHRVVRSGGQILRSGMVVGAIAPRIGLIASSSATAEAALSRPGRPGAQRARALGFGESVDWDSPWVLMRNVDRTNADDAWQMPNGWIGRCAMERFCLQARRGEPLTWHCVVDSSRPYEAQEVFHRSLLDEPAANALTVSGARIFTVRSASVGEGPQVFTLFVMVGLNMFPDL